MLQDISKLVTRSTYAKMRNITQECVRVWIKTKRVKTVKIDTKEFVIIPDEEVEQYKRYSNE